MDKEVIRNLCRWMALRHNLELASIRVGSDQVTRLGSATVRKDIFTGDVEKLSVSISAYNTKTSSEYWNNYSKIKILDTIVHEFAHLALFDKGYNDGHGRMFSEKYHQFLKDDWKELVQIYNLLSTDSLNDSWEVLIKHNEDSYFKREYFEKLLGEDIKLDYLYILRTILSQKRQWLSTLEEIEKFSMNVELGNKEFRVFHAGSQVASLVKETNMLCERSQDGKDS